MPKIKKQTDEDEELDELESDDEMVEDQENDVETETEEISEENLEAHIKEMQDKLTAIKKARESREALLNMPDRITKIESAIDELQTMVKILWAAKKK